MVGNNCYHSRLMHSPHSPSLSGWNLPTATKLHWKVSYNLKIPCNHSLSAFFLWVFLLRINFCYLNILLLQPLMPAVCLFQEELYDLILETNKECLKLCKPGATISQIHNYSVWSFEPKLFPFSGFAFHQLSLEKIKILSIRNLSKKRGKRKKKKVQKV